MHRAICSPVARSRRGNSSITKKEGINKTLCGKNMCVLHIYILHFLCKNAKEAGSKNSAPVSSFLFLESTLNLCCYNNNPILWGSASDQTFDFLGFCFPHPIHHSRHDVTGKEQKTEPLPAEHFGWRLQSTPSQLLLLAIRNSHVARQIIVRLGEGGGRRKRVQSPKQQTEAQMADGLKRKNKRWTNGFKFL